MYSQSSVISLKLPNSYGSNSFGGSVEVNEGKTLEDSLQCSAVAYPEPRISYEENGLIFLKMVIFANRYPISFCVKVTKLSIYRYTHPETSSRGEGV